MLLLSHTCCSMAVMVQLYILNEVHPDCSWSQLFNAVISATNVSKMPATGIQKFFENDKEQIIDLVSMLKNMSG